MDLGKLIFEDTEGLERAEAYRERCLYKFPSYIHKTIFLTCSIAAVSIPIPYYLITGYFGVALMLLMVDAVLIYLLIPTFYGGKNFDIELQPIRIYENGMTFHEFYRSLRYSYKNVSYHTIIFSEVYKVDVVSSEKYNLGILDIYTKSPRECPMKDVSYDEETKMHARRLINFFMSDRNYLIQIFKQRGIPVEYYDGAEQTQI